MAVEWLDYTLLRDRNVEVVSQKDADPECVRKKDAENDAGEYRKKCELSLLLLVDRTGLPQSNSKCLMTLETLPIPLSSSDFPRI